ncbi:MAG: hypothetical protein L3K08_08370, partial [Thermoplasmata archaeon]|nr:hypothetical protein [Thermoplasmata archaeon]
RLRMEIAAAEEDLRQGLQAQVDLRLKEAGDRDLASRGLAEGRIGETIQRKIQESDTKREAYTAALEARLTALVDTRSREVESRLPSTLLGPTSKLPGFVEARVTEAESRLAAREDAHAGELREAQSGSAAELQVRMQAYFDQRLRETADRERETSVELLSRMKTEMDSSLSRIGESLPLQQAIRNQLAKVTEADRGERERGVEERVRQSEARLRNDFLAALHRLEVLEQNLEGRSKELRDVEASVRSDIAELDRRTAILSDRLVPVIRKTWLRIGDLEKGGGAGADSEAAMTQLRRELQRDLRRLESDIATREAGLRDRMETAIANQGRVWLTLIRQLSAVSGERREIPLPSLPAEPEPTAPAPLEDAGELDDLPELLKSRRKGPSAETPDMDDDELGSASRRRRRPSSRG